MDIKKVKSNLNPVILEKIKLKRIEIFRNLQQQFEALEKANQISHKDLLITINSKLK